MTDSNNLELISNDIKKISLDIMINKSKYGNDHDNLLKTINNTFNTNELKELYAISALYDITILKLMPKKIKRDKEYALQLIKTSNTKKSIYIKYDIDNVANEMLSHCIEYDMLYDYQDQYLIEDQVVILHLDRSLRNDKDIIYESVKTCYLTFYYASDKLKNDIEFLNKILQLDNRITRFLSDNIRSKIKMSIG